MKMENKSSPVTQTEIKIGNVTYIVSAAQSEKAVDSLDDKIKRIIKKDVSEIMRSA